MRLLYKKRGFTLVELIAVIAILAVLAAILVPTMLGMVTKARVSAQNNTAATIQRNIDMLLLQADPTYYGILYGRAMTLDITVKTVNNKQIWTCSAAQEGTFTNNNIGNYSWGSGGSYSTDQQFDDIRVGESAICALLSDKMTIVKGSMAVVLQSGKCTFVAFTDETDDPLPDTEYPVPVNGRPPLTFAWNGETAGISPGGMIIGTAPVIAMG